MPKNPASMSLRPLTSCLVLGLLIASSAACGGERQVPETYDWDRSASALVASRGYAGGNVPQLVRFLGQETGAGFVRVYGDGTVYYGEPQQVFVRKLDEDAMQALFQGMRPELFGGYQQRYQAAMVTDAPTTDVSVAVKVYGSHEVGIYGLGAVDGESKNTVPTSLLDATQALAALKTSGQPFEPTKLRLGAEAIDPTRYPKLDASLIPAWPIAAIDLSTLSFYQNKRRVIDDAGQVAAVLAAVPAVGDSVWAPSQQTVFSQGGQIYHVAWAVALR